MATRPESPLATPACSAGGQRKQEEKEEKGGKVVFIESLVL